MNLPWTKPEENDRVELVDIRNTEGRKHEEKKYMSQDEVASEITELGNLAEELTAGLRERVPTHVVPLTGPPSDV